MRKPVIGRPPSKVGETVVASFQPQLTLKPPSFEGGSHVTTARPEQVFGCAKFVGSPVRGTTPSGSQADSASVTERIVGECGLPRWGTTGPAGSDHGPGPFAFTARTRNV